MKKSIFILSIALANIAIAQNEWNSTNSSGVPMYRNGNVAIGTGAVSTLPFAVKNSLPGTGTKIAFGNNNIIGSYGVADGVLELHGATASANYFLGMNTNASANRSALTFGISIFGAQIISSKYGTGTAYPLIFMTDGGPGATERLKINTDGTIGIGIPPSYPTGYKLYVTDGILTEKVKVAVKTSTAWSDYVFNANYKLMPLKELGSYIKKNKHLPNIPTAEEVVKDGIDVATMDAKLLQKIEELTLHIIELEKRIHQLEKK
jgi:hypothetical protein